jgi:hypothetical protein
LFPFRHGHFQDLPRSCQTGLRITTSAETAITSAGKAG